MAQFKDSKMETRLDELHNKGEELLVQTLAPKYGLQYVNLQGVTIDPVALRIVTEQESRGSELAVFERGPHSISVAIRTPNNPRTKEMLKKLEESGHSINLYMASYESLSHAWERYKDTVATTAKKKGVLDVSPEDILKLSKDIKTHLDVAEHIYKVRGNNSSERITNTIEVMFAGALALGASDIHMEPEQHSVRLRYRLDGVLWDICDIETIIYPLVNSRLKLLSGLKLNIHNEAQDGRFTFDIGNRKLEIRSSVIPGAYGESFVMRLLDPTASSFQVAHLGLNERLLAVMESELTRPNGAIITTGPTGSGKTTALYAFMQKVHSPEKKIVTIENPIEYKLEGIVQTQVDKDYSFELGLRAILRQDPDVIMVGEIRDREVAETVIHAALTGHLVFTTLHTNSAASAFARLIDLGVDDRMIGSAINIVLGQRLVRKLCDTCKVSRDATLEEIKLIARILGTTENVHTLYEAPGCEACGASGFKGRIGIFEGIVVDKAVEEAVLRDQREHSILRAAAPQRIPTMQQDGMMKVLAGITSLDELTRVIDLYNEKRNFSENLEPANTTEH